MISSKEVTPLDILCGRDKTSYNHVANRRFRFLVALNRERYRSTTSRRAKSAVVQSLYRQIRDAGGRFLVKQRGGNDLFLLVSEKVAREKISHALRDKVPAKTNLARIKDRLRQEAASSKRFGDDLFVAANASILQTDLPNNSQATDSYVESVLAIEVEAILIAGDHNEFTSFSSRPTNDHLLGVSQQLPISTQVPFNSLLTSSIDNGEPPSDSLVGEATAIASTAATMVTGSSTNSTNTSLFAAAVTRVTACTITLNNEPVDTTTDEDGEPQRAPLEGAALTKNDDTPTTIITTNNNTVPGGGGGAVSQGATPQPPALQKIGCKSPLSPFYLPYDRPCSPHELDGDFDELFADFPAELIISPTLPKKLVNSIMEVLDLPQCFDERDCQDLVDMHVDASRL